MRIFHISWEYPPVIYGGLGRHVLALTRAQAAAGHDVTVITQRPAASRERERIDGVTVVRMGSETPPVRRDVTGLMRWTADLDRQLAATVVDLDEDPPDVVHVHDWVVECAARAAGEHWPVPVVATVHATEAGRHAGWINGEVSRRVYAAEWRLARRATAVITCSPAMAAEARELYQLPDERVFAIPNGIDLAGWSGETAEPAGTPESARDAGKGFDSAPSRGQRPAVVLFVGRLEWEKGVQVLIEATKLLPEEPRVRVVIAGVGTQTGRFHKLAAGDDRVSFAGHLPDAELRQKLSSASAVVVPSLYEPFGIVALEAAAAGAPLIVSEVGGLAGVVTDGVTGRTMPPNDPVALADAITQVLADPATAAACAARLRARLPLDYSWDHIAQRTVAVYRQAQHLPRPAPVAPTATPPQPTGQLLECGW